MGPAPVSIELRPAPLPVDVYNPHGLLRLLGHGGYGVELFFAISGFILAWPFARQHLRASQKVALSSYFLRRITRLEPPYILALLLRAILLLAMGFYKPRFIFVHLIASILYVHNITFGIASRIEAVSWTLEIEVQFYCLAPLLTLIYNIPRAWLRRALLICAIATATPLQRAFLSGWHGPANASVFNLSILAFIQFFLVGLLVADLYVDGWDQIPQTWWWDLLSIPLWFLMFWLKPHAFGLLRAAHSTDRIRGRVQGNPHSRNSPQSCHQHDWRHVLQHLSDSSDHYTGTSASTSTLSSSLPSLAGYFSSPGCARITCSRCSLLSVD